MITYLTTGIKYKQKKAQTKTKCLQSDNIEYELETRVRGTEGQTMNASLRKALGHSCKEVALNQHIARADLGMLKGVHIVCRPAGSNL